MAVACRRARLVHDAGPRAPANLAFQSEEHDAPPVWPAGDRDAHMMLHLDIGARDVDAAVAAARDLGARPAGFQPQEDVRVMLDPAGHPFCLYEDR
nr:VOC family protein [Brachybacterium sp. P6-10-X1]